MIDLKHSRPPVLHALDTRVQMFPQIPVPHHEVSAGGGYCALRLQADLQRGLPMGRVEESLRQEKLEKLEKRLCKIDLTCSSKYFFSHFSGCFVIFVLICHFLCQLVIQQRKQ